MAATIEVVIDDRSAPEPAPAPGPPIPMPYPSPVLPPHWFGSGSPFPAPRLPPPKPPTPDEGDAAPLPVPGPTPPTPTPRPPVFPPPLPTPVPAPLPTPPVPPPVVATPVAMPAPPRPGLGSVSAFDRPLPVIIMGPRPLPVSMEGGAGAGPPAPKPVPPPKPEKPPEGWDTWLLRQTAMGAAGTATAVGGFANNRVMPAFQAAVGGATNALSALGPKGMAAAAAVDAVGKAAGAAVGMVNSFVNRGRELAAYSGRLSVASATADIRKINTDIYQADRLEKPLAKLIDLTSKIEAAVSRTLVPATEATVNGINWYIEAEAKRWVMMLEVLNKLPLIAGKLTDLIEDIKKILGGDDLATLDKMVEEWLNAPKGLKLPGALPVPPAVGLGKIPLVVP